jgi:hypothetical protein
LLSHHGYQENNDEVQLALVEMIEMVAQKVLAHLPVVGRKKFVHGVM